MLLPFVLLAALTPDRIDAIVSNEMRTQKIPGLTLAVIKKGRVVKVKGYGEANVEHHVPATEQTIYQSGSVGKQFTATLAMMLVHDKKMSLEDPISKWFPEGGEAWKSITVRHLLSHTSGLPDMPYRAIDITRRHTEDELVKILAELPAVEPPGTKWRYNNGGYVLLGVLIHRLTGIFYGDLLRDRIFKPLGMNTAQIISERDIVPHRASGYELTPTGLKNQSYVNPTMNTTADGSLYLSIQDYIKWDAGLRSEKLLPRDELAQTWTPGRLANGSQVGESAGSESFGYGFGWIVLKVRGEKFIEHNGAWQGFSTYIGRLLDTGTTVVVLTNLDAGHSSPEIIGRKIFGLDVPALAPKLEE